MGANVEGHELHICNGARGRISPIVPYYPLLSPTIPASQGSETAGGRTAGIVVGCEGCEWAKRHDPGEHMCAHVRSTVQSTGYSTYKYALCTLRSTGRGDPV